MRLIPSEQFLAPIAACFGVTEGRVASSYTTTVNGQPVRRVAYRPPGCAPLYLEGDGHLSHEAAVEQCAAALRAPVITQEI